MPSGRRADGARLRDVRLFVCRRRRTACLGRCSECLQSFDRVHSLPRPRTALTVPDSANGYWAQTCMLPVGAGATAAHLRHICATSAPHLHRDCATSAPGPCHICAGTAPHTLVRVCSVDRADWNRGQRTRRSAGELQPNAVKLWQRNLHHAPYKHACHVPCATSNTSRCAIWQRSRCSLQQTDAVRAHHRWARCSSCRRESFTFAMSASVESA